MKQIDELPAVGVAVKPLPPETPAAPRSKRGKQPAATEKTPPPNGRFVASPLPTFDLSVTEPPSREQIRERAYFIYLARNGAPGDAQADWLQAEHDLAAERSRTTARRMTGGLR